MKTLFLLIALMAANFAYANTTLGVQDAVYVGSGLLKSRSLLVPTIAYTSTRVLQNGVITARTRAELHGLPVGGAQAKLKVKMISETEFVMLDLESNSAICGKGSCSAKSCSFTATVMNGNLKLTETWVPTANGFSVVNARQVMYGIESLYSGQFVPQK